MKSHIDRHSRVQKFLTFVTGWHPGTAGDGEWLPSICLSLSSGYLPCWRARGLVLVPNFKTEWFSCGYARGPRTRFRFEGKETRLKRSAATPAMASDQQELQARLDSANADDRDLRARLSVAAREVDRLSTMGRPTTRGPTCRRAGRDGGRQSRGASRSWRKRARRWRGRAGLPGDRGDAQEVARGHRKGVSRAAKGRSPPTRLRRRPSPVRRSGCGNGEARDHASPVRSSVVTTTRAAAAAQAQRQALQLGLDPGARHAGPGRGDQPPAVHLPAPGADARRAPRQGRDRRLGHPDPAARSSRPRSASTSAAA